MAMKTEVVIALAACVLAAACAPVAPKPTADAKSATCNTTEPGARCNVAVLANGSQYRCELGTFDVDPQVVELRGGRPINIFWTLSEPYAFCGQDQVYLKPGVNKDTLQPYESFGSETDDGARGANQAVFGKCKTKWHWNWSNNGSDLYVYNIQFTDTRTGRKCTIDPFIRNG